jgi:hypothetical protein|nr:MAG TPA: ATP dependent DNA ligase [Crassvirales sp.]
MKDNTLYRRNNHGTPCYWYAEPLTQNTYHIHHGIVGSKDILTTVCTKRDSKDEVKSKYKEKLKQGYKYLNELRDDTVCSPVEEDALLQYLQTYLPHDRTTADGTLLPMLAKVYNDNVFNKISNRLGQYKINGLRCLISAERNEGDIFTPHKLLFQSREGTYWNTLYHLENYLLEVIPDWLLEKMIDEDYVLDGEIYLPGYSVNEINHFVKNSKCIENAMLQYWCYDIAIQDYTQFKRLEELYKIKAPKHISCKEEHLNNVDRFVILPIVEITTTEKARRTRDKFIDIGFEGLILRDPDAEYQFGKRNNTMIKYKRTTDGVFEVIDIYPEGTKRSDIPLLLCRNDVNNNTFEVHVNGSFDYQHEVLINRDKYIGRKLFITFGERSGVDKVPFHVKEVKFID